MAKADQPRCICVWVGSTVWPWQRATMVRSRGEAGRGTEADAALTRPGKKRGCTLMGFEQRWELGSRRDLTSGNQGNEEAVTLRRTGE